MTTESSTTVEQLRCLGAMMRESSGIAGYHLNGDLEPWGDLASVPDEAADLLELRGRTTGRRGQMVEDLRRENRRLRWILETVRDKPRGGFCGLYTAGYNAGLDACATTIRSLTEGMFSD